MTEYGKTDHEKAIERIRGLLAKAASSEFDAEREAFEAKAVALMAEHEIAERELQEPSNISQAMIDLTSFGRAGKGAACLAAWITELLGGYAVLVSFRDGKSGRVKVYCTSAQRDRLDLLLDHLLPQLRAALTKDKPRSRMSYSLAWAHAVLQRLSESHTAAYATHGALVPTNIEAEAAYQAENGRPGSMSLRVEAASANAGTAAGHEADLGYERLPT
mgnify:CR=1 FL=1